MSGIQYDLLLRNGRVIDPANHMDQRADVADIFVGFRFLPDQDLKDPHISPDLLIVGTGHEVTDVRRSLLAVSVHASVSLLEDHQRPGNIKMDHAMAEIVQVDAFRRHIAGY